jgi:membrane protein required for colicin V production
MSYLDIVFAIPLVWFAWKGFTKGLIIELAGLIALALGIYISLRFAGFTAKKLDSLFGLSQDYLNLLAFVVTFVGVVALVFLFAKLIEGAIKKVNLSLLNKLAGMVFAMMKAALILSSLIYVLNRFDAKHQFLPDSVRQKSLLFSPVEKLAPAIYPYMDITLIREKAESLVE